MKILKQLAVAAVASAVLLTGCQNSFTGTTRDLSVLSEANRSAGSSGITSASASAPVALVNAANQQIVLTFSEPVDTATLATAVTVYPVTGTVGTTLYTRGTAIPFTYQYSSGNSVTLLGNLSTLTTSALEVYVNPAVLTARNGAIKLDLDSDKIQGEAGDDDAYLYLTGITQATATSPTITTAAGAQRNPRAYFGITPAGSFTVTGTATIENTYSWTYSNTYDTGTDTYDYKSIFDSSLVIEKYVPVANAVGSWTAVSKSSTYVPATGVYTVTFTGVVDGDVLRARVTNLSSLVTNGEFNGFKQKISVALAGVGVTEKELVAPSRVSSSVAAEQFEIPLATQLGAFSIIPPSVAFDSNNLNGVIVLSITNNPLGIGDKGIDTSTVLPANIKLVDTKGNSIAWTSYKVTQTSPTTGAAREIALYLDPTYQKQTNSYGVYLTSGLKTFAGSSGAAPYTLARKFGDVTNVNTLPALIGTYKIATLTF